MKHWIRFWVALWALFVFAGNVYADGKFPLFTNIAKDFKYLATSPTRLDAKSAFITLGAVGVGVGLYFSDENIRDFFQDHQNSFFDDLAPAAEKFGYWPAGLGFVALYGGSGYLMQNEKMQETSFLALESFLVANSISVSVKYATGRARPKRDKGSKSFEPFSFKTSDTSFPSGHTTTAFSLASVFADEYANPWVDVLAYGLASLTAWERLYDDKHWASDVWAGFILGTVVGKSVVYLHKKTDLSAYLLPLFGQDAYGLMLVGRF